MKSLLEPGSLLRVPARGLNRPRPCEGHVVGEQKKGSRACTPGRAAGSVVLCVARGKPLLLPVLRVCTHISSSALNHMGASRHAAQLSSHGRYFSHFYHRMTFTLHLHLLCFWVVGSPRRCTLMHHVFLGSFNKLSPHLCATVQ